MNFFRSMEIDPHLQIFTTSIAVRRNLLLWVLCTSTFSRNQDPKQMPRGSEFSEEDSQCSRARRLRSKERSVPVLMSRPDSVRQEAAPGAE